MPIQIPQLLKRVPRVSLSAKGAALFGVWGLIISFALIIALSVFVYYRYTLRVATSDAAEFKAKTFSSTDFGAVMKLIGERREAFMATTTVANPPAFR